MSSKPYRGGHSLGDGREGASAPSLCSHQVHKQRLLLTSHRLFFSITSTQYNTSIFHQQTQTFSKPKSTSNTFTMETIKNAANYVAESVQGTGATASKEANKSESTALPSQHIQWLTASQALPRTATLPSAPVPPPPRMPSLTRSMRAPTT
jgi:hypothetical protein